MVVATEESFSLRFREPKVRLHESSSSSDLPRAEAVFMCTQGNQTIGKVAAILEGGAVTCIREPEAMAAEWPLAKYCLGMKGAMTGDECMEEQCKGSRASCSQKETPFRLVTHTVGDLPACTHLRL